jgi:hypothetical protein
MANLAGASLVLAVAAATVAVSWHGRTPQASSGQSGSISGQARDSAHLSAAADRASDRQLADSIARARLKVAHATTHRREGTAPSPVSRQIPRKPVAVVYLNPLRAITGLIPERVDMGADFGGTGPIYPIGRAVITNATGNSAGWPGGGWITYQLTVGPGKGLQVYVAEDVTPTVSVGQVVTPSTVIAHMHDGSAGIETGWAMPNGFSAESQLPAAGAVSGGGPFPTKIGLSFDQLLHTLGVAAAPNSGQPAFGVLPSSYPRDWSAIKGRA